MENEIDARLRATAPALGGSGFVFQIGTTEGRAWRIDGRASPAIITGEHGEGDCQITLGLDVLKSLLEKRMNPMAAYMMGRIKLSGSQVAAMQLVSALSA